MSLSNTSCRPDFGKQNVGSGSGWVTERNKVVGRGRYKLVEP